LQVALEVGLGAIAALLFVLAARLAGAKRELRIYAGGLVVAAVIYLGFALLNGGADRLGLELLGVLAFTAVAVLSLRVSPALVGAGWAAHVAWDVVLHGGMPAPYVPGWYPTVCVGFDLLVAGYVLVSRRRWAR
jgi:hypothetical protein